MLSNLWKCHANKLYLHSMNDCFDSYLSVLEPENGTCSMEKCDGELQFMKLATVLLFHFPNFTWNKTWCAPNTPAALNSFVYELNMQINSSGKATERATKRIIGRNLSTFKWCLYSPRFPINSLFSIFLLLHFVYISSAYLAHKVFKKSKMENVSIKWKQE